MSEEKPRPGPVSNIADPVELKDVQLCGVTAEAVQGGGEVQVWTRLAIDSDTLGFHKIVEGLSGAIQTHLAAVGRPIDLRTANSILMVVRADDTAQVWVDTAAQSTTAILKRPVAGGEPIFEKDIADVRSIDFPCVEIGETDRIVFIFRVNWRFGLYFHLDRDTPLDRAGMSLMLGDMYRTLRYRDLYETTANGDLLKKLAEAGWFPFIELKDDFHILSSMANAGFDIAAAEAEVIAKFDRARLDAMFERWMTRPHFSDKESLLRSAINTYLAGEPVAAIKIILTEIEGVLASAYRAVHGKGAKTNILLKFALDSAHQQAGSANSLFFPAAFGEYLNAYTFANFDPDGPRGTASSRHAVGHGAADAPTYTQARALQAILTLDQLSWYTA